MDDLDRKKCSRVEWPNDRRQFHYLDHSHSLSSLEFDSDCCWFKARDCFTVRRHYGMNTDTDSQNVQHERRSQDRIST